MLSSSAIVGRNIRRLRSARGVAAAELARRAGLARATLTELENGRGNPTLDTLATLASELGTTLADLLTATDEDRLVHVTAGHGAQKRNGPIDARLLHRSAVGGALIEQWHLVIDATSEPFPAPAHAHGVVESLYVVDGVLLAGPAPAPVRLNPGDALTYPADQQHCYGAPARAVRAVMTMLYPAAGSGTGVLSAGLP